MAKRKVWTDEEIAKAKVYLKMRVREAIDPTEFSVSMGTRFSRAMQDSLDGLATGDGLNAWADNYLSQKGWTRLLNFLRVSSHRADEKAQKEEKGEEEFAEEKAQVSAEKAALDYVSRLNAEELAAFLRRAHEKQQRRARHRRQRRKEDARAEQEKRERARRHQQHQQRGRQRAYSNPFGGAIYTVKECKAALNKCHPDKGGDEAEAKKWTERLEAARKRERAAA